MKSKPVRPESSPKTVPGVDIARSQTMIEWAKPLLDALSEGVFIVDASGLIRFANLHAAALFGWDRTKLIGQSIDKLLPPRLRQVHAKHREKYMQRPVQRPMGIGRELLGHRMDGSEFPIEISLSSFDTEAGAQIVCLVTDISQRLEAEARLRTIANRFETLFKAFPLPAYIWQRQGDDFVLIVHNEVDRNFNASATQSFLGRSLSAMYPEGGQEVADI